MGTLPRTVVAFWLYFSGFSLWHALNTNASLLQVSSISNFRSSFIRLLSSGSSKPRTEWLIGCSVDSVDDVDGATFAVAAAGCVFRLLDNAFICTYGSSYTSVFDLLLLLPTITNRFGNDSVELELDNANLKKNFCFFRFLFEWKVELSSRFSNHTHTQNTHWLCWLKKNTHTLTNKTKISNQTVNFCVLSSNFTNFSRIIIINHTNMTPFGFQIINL